jgi:Fic family protein
LNNADPDALVEPGCFRTTARHAIGVGQRVVVYMDPQAISQAMDEFVATMKQQLEISCQRGPNPRMFLLIAHIFYKFLLIHPFGDGNGRMARLLANHVLILHGVDLPVSFVAGKHKRAHAHYGQVLDRAQHKDSHPSRLATFAAEMLNQTYSAFITK